MATPQPTPLSTPRSTSLSTPLSTPLSTIDAFFVAYQEQSGISMHFGAEVELAGVLARATVEAAVAHAIARWPALGQTLASGLAGLQWRGGGGTILHESRDPGEVQRWRNAPIDPFREPPFGVLWIAAPDGRRHVLAFRSHHAVADGQLFFAIVAEILGALAGPPARREPGPVEHPLAFATLWRQTRLVPSWRHARSLAREARADRSARIAVREVRPGDVAICTRALDDTARRGLVDRAAAAHLRPAWLVAAAWLQALGAWNAAHGETNPLLSLEVPVNLRRGARAMVGTGNHLSVLTVFGDSRLPLVELARGLSRQYTDGLRRRAHLAVPLLSAAIRLLPWPVFRRVAVTSSSTGFATTHFTWLHHEPDPRAEVALRSGGALAVIDEQIYTPVCLQMGAALSVLAWPDELRLTITHRLSGVSAADADQLAALVGSKLRSR